MDSQVSLTIELPQPFDLASSLESGQAFRWHRHGDWRYGVVSGRLVALRQDGKELHVRASSEPEAVAADVRDYLRMDDDMEAVYARFGTDDHLARSVAAYRGMRILRQDPWECLVAFICSANSSIPRISDNMNSIAGSMGEPLLLDGHQGFTFPSPQQAGSGGRAGAAQAAPGLSCEVRRKGRGACRERRAGRGVAAPMSPTSEAKDVLTALPGVGEKVADCVLLMSLDKPKAFPVDRWIRRAVEEWYLDGAKLNYNGVREWSWERWGDMAGYANQYLFQLAPADGSRSPRGEE